MGVDVEIQFLEPRDWRADIFNYLKDSARGAPRRIRLKAMKYVLIGDEVCSCMRFTREPAVLINRLIR